MNPPRRWKEQLNNEKSDGVRDPRGENDCGIGRVKNQ